MVRNIPAEGEMLVTADSVYSYGAYLTQEQLENIADFERLMTADGVTVLKFFLHITPEQRAKTSDDYNSYVEGIESVLRTTAYPIPWYVVPSEKKWYRDYVMASIIAENVENVAKSAENVTSCSN
jgi:polyphosphate kinase 2 (PPK2 family)